jgi:hypothetical protein
MGQDIVDYLIDKYSINMKGDSQQCPVPSPFMLTEYLSIK